MYSAVFFDLDGTLTDPKVGITRSVAYALNFYGIQEEPDRLIPFIGPPLTDSFMRFYGFSREKAVQAVDKYREYFTVTGIWENRLYPGVPELLDALRGRGIRLALATSKPEVFARQILEYFGIAGRFDVIRGSFLDGRRTRKAEVIRAAWDALKEQTGRPIPLEECLMVGDRLHDVEGAREVGMDSAGLSFGYGGEQELREAGATQIVPSLEALLPVITGAPAAGVRSADAPATDFTAKKP